MPQPCLYILASKRNGTRYIGVTNDIARRVWEHRTGAVKGFSKEYGTRILVYVEYHPTMPDAILREKQMKKWRRIWKLKLIEQGNPDWRDLYEDLLR